MTNNFQPIPKPVAAGACFALLAIFLGFALGVAFGAKESAIKDHLNESGTTVLESVYHGDVDAKKAVVSKSWSYLKRSHMHGSAIGTSALVAILALLAFGARGGIANFSALAFGLGAVIYSLFWLFAGLSAPAIGSTGAAKESLAFLALPGAGLSMLGLCGTLFSVAKASFFAPSKP